MAVDTAVSKSENKKNKKKKVCNPILQSESLVITLHDPSP